MSTDNKQGVGPVLANSDFRALWIAQLLAQTSQHAIHFIQMVLIEELTGSAVQLGLVILAFTLPGVIFSPLAGVVVDRFPKKWVLAGSNLVRVGLALSYVLVLATLRGTWELVAIYSITFLTASLAQFFGPAEAATIPLLVGEKHLLAANSLFSLTMAVSQVVGLVILGPLAITLVHVRGGFVIIAAMYLGATILVSRIPGDAKVSHTPIHGMSRWHRVWVEAREGWEFVSGQPRIVAAMAHFITVNTLVMIMAMLAPGYAARVLGMAPENAVIVFAPAGVGMLLSTLVVSRWGHILRRVGAEYFALVATGLAFVAMGLLSLDYQRLLQPILHVYPQAALSLTSATMVLGLILGLFMSGVNILAQTVVQQESPPYIRGRVFSVQFMLGSLVGIPPMLALGGLADAIGIPRVMVIVGVTTIALAALSVILSRGRLNLPWQIDRSKPLSGLGQASSLPDAPHGQPDPQHTHE